METKNEFSFLEMMKNIQKVNDQDTRTAFGDDKLKKLKFEPNLNVSRTQSKITYYFLNL